MWIGTDLICLTRCFVSLINQLEKRLLETGGWGGGGVVKTRKRKTLSKTSSES